ncbi:MAG: MFS transporter, partial [bacterium]
GISDRVIALFILNVHPSISNTTLACFFALSPLMTGLMVLTIPLAAIFGKKRILTPFYLADVPFLILLAILPSLHGIVAPTTLVMLVALSLIGYGAFRSLGMAGWFPLISDNVPDNIRGRFFGRLRTSWQLMLVAYTAAVGWLLGHNPALWKFQVVFVIAVLTNLLMTAGIPRIPEAPLARRSSNLTFWQTLAVPFQDRPFVYFLLFGSLFNLAAAMSGPFALLCLKGTLGAGDNFIVWMDTAASIGAAATLPLSGRIVDRFGGRIIFALLVPALAALNLIWLFANPMDPHWRIMMIGFHMLQGILIFGIGVGITDMMLGSARPGHQSAYINIAFVLNVLAVGVGPFLGTLVARVFSGCSLNWGAMTLDSNRCVFLCRFFLMLTTVWIVARLSRKHGGSIGETWQRFTSGLFELLPSIRR